MTLPRFFKREKKIGPKKGKRTKQPAECGAGSRLHPRYPSRGVTNQYHIYSQHFACVCKESVLYNA